MDKDESAIVSGDIENIVIKPESIELLFDDEDPLWLEEDSGDSDPELPGNNFDECCFVTSSGEVVMLNNEDIVQTPFYLESYFLDNDRFRSKSPCMPMQQCVLEVDRVTCYECDIVFCNEHKLLEHLMTHIDVYRMGCDVCDKDLNLEEKFQLHMMAVTWQSIYYCDFCRKSCAGVVRSKSQPPPPGKTYMCHDCEYLTKQETMSFQNSNVLYENVVMKPVYAPPVSSQEFLQSPVPPPLPQPPPVVLPPPTPPPPQQPPPPSLPPNPSTTEVLQDQKQKPNNEVKHELCSTESTTPEIQDCYKSLKTPPKKKENKKCRRPKPKVQVVKESLRQTLKVSTRSHTRDRNKVTRSYKCRYCPVAFTDDYALMTHLRDKHKFHKLRYVCKLCGKDFTQQRSYENHASIHQLSKNHMCFVCNLAFLSKYELDQHARCFHDKSELISSYCDGLEGVALDLRKKSTA